jgi:hypothetical protein
MGQCRDCCYLQFEKGKSLMDESSQVVDLANSILEKYFPELKNQVNFRLEEGEGDSVSGRARLGLMDVVITYGDGRVLQPKYRFALVPLIAHELAHLINPVAPEDAMRKRLPAAIMTLWEAIATECSIEQEKGGNRESDN